MTITTYLYADAPCPDCKDGYIDKQVYIETCACNGSCDNCGSLHPIDGGRSFRVEGMTFCSIKCLLDSGWKWSDFSEATQQAMEAAVLRDIEQSLKCIKGRRELLGCVATVLAKYRSAA